MPREAIKILLYYSLLSSMEKSSFCSSGEAKETIKLNNANSEIVLFFKYHKLSFNLIEKKKIKIITRRIASQFIF